MKRLVSFLLAVILCLGVCSLSFAEEEIEATESQFEKITLKKGSLLQKQYTTVNSISGLEYYGGSSKYDKDYDPIYVQTAVLTDIETGSNYYALRFLHDYYRGSSSTSGVTVLDSDEIDGVLTTLKYVKEHSAEFVPYTDVAYTANGGAKIGAFVGAKNSYYYIELNSYDTVYFEMNKADELISFFTQSQDSLKSIMN